MNQSKTQLAPVHIIEVDCSCFHGWRENDDGEFTAKCEDCNGKGKRRRAVWEFKLPQERIWKSKDDDRWFIDCDENDPGEKVETLFNDKELIAALSSYKSNTELPTGETLEEVELMQGSTIIDMLSNPEQVVEFVITGEKPEPAGMKEFVLWSNDNKANVDTWLCTAMIKE